MSTTPSELTRRSVLRRAAAVGVLATPAAGLLAACATSSSDNNTDGQKAGTKTDANPLGMPEDGTTEVVIFNGGYGEK